MTLEPPRPQPVSDTATPRGAHPAMPRSPAPVAAGLNLSRRLVLPAALGLATPALAQPRQPPAAARGGAARAPAVPTSPATTPLGPLDTQARQALIIDFDTDAVLLEKNAEERMPPSSMSKLMTIYMVFDRLRAGRLTMSQELPVSERAWRMGGSKMFVQVGTSVPV